MKIELGPSDKIINPKSKRGYSIWIENGVYYTAKTVNKKKFGPHAYDEGGYYLGIHNCPCGCYMGSSSSSGPVDPFGPCPMNPKGYDPSNKS